MLKARAPLLDTCLTCMASSRSLSRSPATKYQNTPSMRNPCYLLDKQQRAKRDAFYLGGGGAVISDERFNNLNSLERRKYQRSAGERHFQSAVSSTPSLWSDLIFIQLFTCLAQEGNNRRSSDVAWQIARISGAPTENSVQGEKKYVLFSFFATAPTHWPYQGANIINSSSLIHPNTQHPFLSRLLGLWLVNHPPLARFNAVCWPVGGETWASALLPSYYMQRQTRCSQQRQHDAFALWKSETKWFFVVAAPVALNLLWNIDSSAQFGVQWQSGAILILCDSLVSSSLTDQK